MLCTDVSCFNWTQSSQLIKSLWTSFPSALGNFNFTPKVLDQRNGNVTSGAIRSSRSRDLRIDGHALADESVASRSAYKVLLCSLALLAMLHT